MKHLYTLTDTPGWVIPMTVTPWVLLIIGLTAYVCCCYMHQKKNKGILRKVNVGNGSETGEVTRDPERLHVLEIDQEQQDVSAPNKNFYCHHIDNRSIIIYLKSNVILSINFNMIQVTF